MDVAMSGLPRDEKGWLDRLLGLAADVHAGESVTALLLAVPLRRNLPVALVVTFYTNPFTIVPLYLVAYGYGKLMLNSEEKARIEPFEWDWSEIGASMDGLWHWMLGLGKPLAIGLPALAVTLAVLGYLAVDVLWRVYVITAWRARKKRRRKPGQYRR